MHTLPDGAYAVIVIDVEEIRDEGARIEVVITSGEHKSEVVAVRATHVRGDAFDMLGLPGTLTVRDGTPHFAVDT